MSGRERPDRVMGSGKGFTYISALVFVAIMGITLNTAGGVWSAAMKREREQELLFAGDQIRKAIESYHKHTPGGRAPEYPRSLQDLLKDPRYPSVRRHLRRVYRNPMSKDGTWEYVLDKRGTIKGVFANSREAPTKKARFPAGYESFEKAAVYSDWKFTQGLDQQALPAGSPVPGNSSAGDLPNSSPAAVPGPGAKESLR